MLLDVQGGLHTFSLVAVLTLALIALTVVYPGGWYRLQTPLPKVLRTWRLAALVGGLFSLWAAAESPLAALEHRFLTVHMVKHLVLMTVAAPLILLGLPPIILLNGLPKYIVNRVLVPLLRSAPVRTTGRMVGHPAFCWVASTAAVIGWHVPALFELGLRSARWHGVEQACFLLAGLLFWWPVVQPWPSLVRWPRWSVPLYLFLATLPCDALSAFLTFCDRVVYPHYLSAHQAFSTSALADQERAGALMWVCITFAYLVPAAVVTIQMLSPRERHGIASGDREMAPDAQDGHKNKTIFESPAS
jgi:putative membrane protein